MTAHVDQLAPADALPRRGTITLAHRWDLVLTLIGRDLRLRYNRSVMGIAWSFVTPLSQLLVLNLVFTRVVPLGIPEYGSFLFVGLLSWTWFSMALDQATGSIVDHRELVRQPGFPVGLLPVITVATNLVQFLLAMPVLALVMIVADISPGPSLVVLPLLIAVQFLFTLGLSFFIATFHVTFRDTKHLLSVLLLLGFYLTPIFYPAERAPKRLALMYELNPMAILIESYRDVLLEDRMPPVVPLLLTSGVSVLLLIVGYRVFRRASDRFVDEI